jgi:hypothetical protein
MSIFLRQATRLGCPHCTNPGSDEDADGDTCPGCGNLDPWSKSSVRMFYTKGNKEDYIFTRMLRRGEWQEAAQFCLRCKILHAALPLREGEGIERDFIEVQIHNKPGSGGLVLDRQFSIPDDRVELFIPAGVYHNFKVPISSAQTLMSTAK